MVEHYDPDILEISRRLYEQIRTWGQDKAATLIGGWAVYEQVEPLMAQQSRDIDLVIHDLETLLDFSRRLNGWGLTWREKGRNRFNDCHLIGDETKTILVDVFKSSPFKDSVFKGRRMMAANPVKPIPIKDWLPSVEFLVREKLKTIPLRVRDREDKRLKDFVDLHNLVFHNKLGLSARDLAEIHQNEREQALAFLPAAKDLDKQARNSAYSEELERVERWLADSHLR